MKKHSEETKRKISKALKGKRKTHEHVQHMIESLKAKGSHLTVEHRQKLSLSLLGNKYRAGIPHTQEICAKMSRHHRLKNSVEQNMKISEANRKRIWQIETKRKMSNIAKKRFANPENHPNWQGGIAMHPYTCKFKASLKEAVRQRDNYQCQLCGVLEIECLSKLNIHHINYDKANVSDTNLISLCRRCNVKVNYNRPYWQTLFELKMHDIKESPVLTSKGIII